jgi:hypothetical protein
MFIINIMFCCTAALPDWMYFNQVTCTTLNRKWTFWDRIYMWVWVLLGKPLYYSIQQLEDQIWNNHGNSATSMIVYFVAQKKLFYLKVLAAVVTQKNKQWSSRDSWCFTKVLKNISIVQWKKSSQAKWLCTIVRGFQLYDGSCSPNIVISVNNLTYIYV